MSMGARLSCVRLLTMWLSLCAQKQSTSLKAYKKWFKALLESSQALVDGRNEAADLDKELKLREKDLQVQQCCQRTDNTP